MAEPNENNNQPTNQANNQEDNPQSETATKPVSDNAEDRPEQSVSIENIAVGEKKLTIEIPEQRIKDKIEEAYVGLENDAQIPGFRKGKAPRKLLQKRFASTLLKETAGQLLAESCSQAIEDEKLNILGEPNIKDADSIELPQSGSLTFEVNVEVAPDVTLPDLTTLKIDKPSAEITDKQVDEEIEKYRQQFGDMAQVENEPVKEGDYITADVAVYAGNSVDENSEPVSTHPESNILVHGEDLDYRGHVANIHVPDMGKHLTGKNIGDNIDISTTGPEKHSEEQIAGKDITLRIKIENIQRVKPADVDQLVQRTGVEDEKQLRDRIREMLEGQAYQEQQQNMQSQAMDQLVEAIDVEIPEALANRQIEQTLAQRQIYQSMQEGSQEQSKEDKEKQKQEVTKQVHDELKRFFIISQAANDFDVNVNNQEIDYEITARAMQSGQRPAKLRKQMRDSGELNQLAMQLREQKTLTEIVGKAKVEDNQNKEQITNEDAENK